MNDGIEAEVGEEHVIMDIATLTEMPEALNIMSALSNWDVDTIASAFTPEQLDNYFKRVNDRRALVYADYMRNPEKYAVVDGKTPSGVKRTTLVYLE